MDPRLHEVDLFHEFLVCLHASFPLFPGQAFGQSGDDGKMKIFALGPVEQDAVGVDECELSAIAEEGDQDGNSVMKTSFRCFGKMRWMLASSTQGNSSISSAACIQRNSQHTTVAIVGRTASARLRGRQCGFRSLQFDPVSAVTPAGRRASNVPKTRLTPDGCGAD